MKIVLVIVVTAVMLAFGSSFLNLHDLQHIFLCSSSEWLINGAVEVANHHKRRCPQPPKE